MDEETAVEMLGLSGPVHSAPPPAMVEARLVDRGDVLAEVAASLSLIRWRGRLTRVEPRTGRPRKGDGGLPEMLCILFGPLVQTQDSRVGFGSIQVGPLLTPHPTDEASLPGVSFH